MSGKIKYLFIDRDGTLIEEPEDFQVDRLDKVRLVPNVIPALLKLQAAGYQLIMVTNQDGLGTDSFPQQDFEGPHNLMLSILNTQGIHFAAEHIDPHFEHDNAPTRKPGIGMLLPYLQSGDMDFQRSAVIGDRQTDMQLADNLGIQGFLLSTDQHDWPSIVHQLLHQPRTASIKRKTNETNIDIAVDLDTSQPVKISTGIGFFDHMLEQLAMHGGFAATVQADGDLHIDEHHTVEDVALALGQALDQALGDRRGIGRYGFTLPMDESQARVAVDLSGRPYFVLKGHLPDTQIGGLSTEMVKHFFHSLAQTLRAAIHIHIEGENSHHQVEAMFKGVGRALRPALNHDNSHGTGNSVPSSKGVL